MNMPKLSSLVAFWWRALRTKPIPESKDIDDLKQLPLASGLIAFNGQIARAFIIDRVQREFGCTSFVETGTYRGSTSAFVSKAFHLPVFTCELDNSSYMKSKMNLFWFKNIKLSHQSSPNFLKSITTADVAGNNPLFYLDAHWNDYLPLSDELSIIAKSVERAVIVIDDFYVPDRDFAYDSYDGQRLDQELVTRSLSERSDYSFYIPDYDPSVIPSRHRAGFCIIVLGQDHDLPQLQFPFDLLRHTAKAN